MKLFTVAKGTDCFLLDKSGSYKPFTTRKDLAFDLEQITADPFHPNQHGYTTIGYEFASKGYYGFVAEAGAAWWNAKYTLFVAGSKVIVI